MRTPTTAQGLRQFDHMTPEDAVLAAWTVAGVRPKWNDRAKNATRNALPLLARALDRMVQQQTNHNHNVQQAMEVAYNEAIDTVRHELCLTNTQYYYVKSKNPYRGCQGVT